jgi:transcriptional regulator with XRE-family HTH domain
MHRTANLFGSYFKELRAKKRLGLRDFCREVEYDPSNWSKIERGLAKPPSNPETLGKWARAVGLEPTMPEWQVFLDLAALANGEIPPDLLADEDLAPLLPAFFRTVRGEKPTEDELRAIAEKIRED